MKLGIQIDAYYHSIDSVNPELLGQWIMEIFGRAVVGGITPATQILVRAMPSYIPTEDGFRTDWIADTHFFESITNVRSPRALVEALTEIVGRYEEAH